ncbi:hypothetical protein CYMTET_35423 [Cymbomonas tetramitiformis]|uniref:Uncharacterized protein n=1 Tax=Cymbomonas tetramitiformis TaxID=36881 RepID=A0AAE0KNY6_9CHLO|nr:hypothetical protein CYMTET_35423 [Cymbomonas tetramitiformis]
MEGTEFLAEVVESVAAEVAAVAVMEVAALVGVGAMVDWGLQAVKATVVKGEKGAEMAEPIQVTCAVASAKAPGDAASALHPQAPQITAKDRPRRTAHNPLCGRACHDFIPRMQAKSVPRLAAY